MKCRGFAWHLVKFARVKQLIHKLLRCIWMLLVFLPGWYQVTYAQKNTGLPTRAELEKEKAQLQRQLEEANAQLEEIRKNKNLTVRQVQLLQNKISLRDRLIENLNDEISLIDRDIRRAYADIQGLEQDLDTLKAEYARQVVYTYKNRSMYDYINFILSANSFNEALHRYAYLKRLRDYRRHQAQSILQTQALLKEKISLLSASKQDRTQALSAQQKQMQQLEQERKEKNQLLLTLKGKEKQILADIEAKRKAQQKLDATLAVLIRREIEEARRKAAEEAARSKSATASASAKSAPAAASSGSAILSETPEEKLISSNFEGNMGRLPWPVEKGYISDPYGRHQHPVLSYVEVENNGVNIDTEKGAVARAVFEGDVVTATFDQYNRWTVILRHGQYFTVYSNLLKPLVKAGEHVQTKQPVGIVYTNDESGETYLHFLIYKGTESMNPALWLSSSH
ncbi:septal ring factor EnvC (AmiA/AmiB activator) [Thermoflavifilum aggregans]|uniref:Septal ring factor EnvC (AmiA/AmiB activator) n=1 Tax=Thermoflavifilum aggregans TaxID=454188 RepID=A0A2M9CT45_9BACT|nr:septal ring factor EnvC (AmiA/AmiB activator) [Thermoflavifilum aggregans]